jgi:tetratricopeptide (TPR) repeat protein
LLLGPQRMWALFLLLALTGLASLILNAFVKGNDWVYPVQSLLLVVFFVGAIIIIGGAMAPEERGRALAIALPAIGAIILGLTVLPNLILPLAGAAIGWIVAGLFIFKGGTRMEYQKAIKALRKNDYETAIDIMDDVIKEEKDDPRHYRFRAEILRLWGKLDRARRDYRKMVELEPDSAEAYNGLAEVCLQSGDYPEALQAAQKACELAPEDWVALYNLGMIEDRLKLSPQVIEHLQQALTLKVPDVRHRLLIHFYLARAYSRLSNLPAAEEEVKAIKKQGSGLNEWQTILKSDQAFTLRAVLGDDVQAAQNLADGKLDVSALGQTS